MKLLKIGKSVLEQFPFVEAWFRRTVWSRVHFPESEMKYLHNLRGKPIDVAIDVGAALGGYAWILNRKSRKVIAFEPGETHSNFMSSALAASSIKLVRKALGNVQGTADFYTPGDDTIALHSATLSAENPVVNGQKTNVKQVEQVTLDGIAKSLMGQNERLDFLKVDVEGYELAVFEGAMRTIKEYQPLVICEIEARHNDRYLEVFNMLRAAGYQAYIYQNNGFVKFDGNDISVFQTEEDLNYRLSENYSPGQSQYINNFVFEHPQSKLKVSQ